MNLDFFTKMEDELNKFNRLNYPVAVAWNQIMLERGIGVNNPMHQFGNMCATHPWFEDANHPYHNAVHTAQVMYSAHALIQNSNVEVLKNNEKWLPLFIIAMMYHDVGHNGKKNQFKAQLEMIAAEKFKIFVNANKKFKLHWEHFLAEEYGDFNEMIGFVQKIILATEVSEEVPKNIENYKQKETPDLMDTLLVLAQEADVLPSVLPNLGLENSKALAKEWNDESVSTKEGRLKFLNYMNYVSEPAKQLNIQSVIENQRRGYSSN